METCARCGFQAKEITIFSARHPSNTKCPCVRPYDDIRMTGAAWATEAELAAICHHAEALLDACLSALNVLPGITAAEGLDVQYHMDKISAAVRAATTFGMPID